jgi:hypothetical protein
MTRNSRRCQSGGPKDDQYRALCAQDSRSDSRRIGAPKSGSAPDRGEAAVVGEDNVAVSAFLGLQDISAALARGAPLILEAAASSGKTPMLYAIFSLKCALSAKPSQVSSSDCHNAGKQSSD